MTLKKDSSVCFEKKTVKAIIITGPTASGKTAVSLKVADAVNGEILCCDSMQVYRHMDIGTAKATPEEQKQVPHHLIDLVEPWEEFSVADYCKAAEAVAGAVASAGKMPVFVGGTGLYVTSLVEGYSYESEYQSDGALRCRLNQMAATGEGVRRLYDFLRTHDPEAADKIHIHNTKRLVRAVELYQLTGKTQQERNLESKQEGPFLDAEVFAIDLERPLLYERINLRVDEMIREGLVEEVESVLRLCRERGESMSKTAAQAIGYKETIAYLKGDLDKEEMVEKIKSATRKYAKRQMTWLRKWPWVKWIRPTDTKNAFNAILLHLSEDADNLS